MYIYIYTYIYIYKFINIYIIYIYIYICIYRVFSNRGMGGVHPTSQKIAAYCIVIFFSIQPFWKTRGLTSMA